MGQYYNLQVLRGLSSARSLLSCRPDGSVVDLWNTDDDSGRQQWVLTEIGGGDLYTIAVRTGTAQGKSYLGVASATSVGLFPSDDGSGNQRWVLTPLASVCDCLPIPSYYQIKPAAGSTGFLSCRADGSLVDLWNVDDGSGRQRWQLQGPGWVD